MIPEEHVQFDRSKFKDAVEYICARCSTDELGTVKLHKILYFADMIHFLGLGTPLTGASYQKQKFGPMARHLSSAVGELAREGRMKAKKRDYFGYEKTDYVVDKPERATGQLLSAAARRVLDEVIDFVCARSAKEMSELSHMAAWEAAEIGETIPYYSSYGLYPSAVTDADVDAAVAQARAVRPQIEAERSAGHFF